MVVKVLRGVESCGEVFWGVGVGERMCFIGSERVGLPLPESRRVFQASNVSSHATLRISRWFVCMFSSPPHRVFTLKIEINIHLL